MAGAGGKHDPPHVPDGFVCPGETIQVEKGFLRGHGTYIDGDSLVSSLSGVVERVNKLVTVRPLRSKYNAEVGDVVVGRVRETARGRWSVEINASRHAVLLLSSVNLPGGVQRRRTAEDELNMRQLFREGDLLSAEVQSLFHDGSASLHTRTGGYGVLCSPVLIRCNASLIVRSQRHVSALPGANCGCDIVLGCNGLVVVLPPHAHNTHAHNTANTARSGSDLRSERGAARAGFDGGFSGGSEGRLGRGREADSEGGKVRDEARVARLTGAQLRRVAPDDDWRDSMKARSEDNGDVVVDLAAMSGEFGGYREPLRIRMARVRNAVEALDRVCAPVGFRSIAAVVDNAVAQGVSAKGMLDDAVIVRITESVRN